MKRFKLIYESRGPIKGCPAGLQGEQRFDTKEKALTEKKKLRAAYGRNLQIVLIDLVAS